MRFENPLYMAEEDSWAQADARDQVGYLDGGLDRFGRSYAGEPERLVQELSREAAVAGRWPMTLPARGVSLVGR
jgi:hypothetical protein